MSAPLRVLIVEDSAEDAELLLVTLSRSGLGSVLHERVDTGPAMEAALQSREWDVILCDYSLPHFDGIAALRLVGRLGRDIPFILVSGAIGEDLAVEAMRLGAHDYLMKDRLARLAPAIRREMAEVIVRQEKRRAQEQLKSAYEDLERKVADRTRDLSQVNDLLLKEIAQKELAQEERNRLNVELLQGQKLQAIGQLSAGIAHEINNPLAYILSNLSCLRTYLDQLVRLLDPTLAAIGRGGTETDQKSALEQVERLCLEFDPEKILKNFRAALEDSLSGTERIRRIVRNLTDFSHMDPHEIQSVDLSQCVENALRLCSTEAKSKAEIVKELVELPPVRCYPQQIEQVLVNLLVNACQAIPERGRIGVGMGLEGGEAVIRIRDSGCGIAPGNLSRLFEPFFTTKPVGKGTGLGLHIAHKIILAHGGRIDVESKEGQGTQFIVRLPFQGPVGKKV